MLELLEPGGKFVLLTEEKEVAQLVREAAQWLGVPADRIQEETLALSVGSGELRLEKA